jgi:prepilin-type N-terminal cleavage/methylation domain-containing protein
LRKAFTVIEMLIVILLLGTLSGLAYFGLTSMKESLDVRSAAEQVYSEIRLTQEMAKTNHYPHQIEFIRGGNEYQIVDLRDDTIVKKEKLSDTIRFDGKEMFIFSYSGSPVVGGSGTLVISNFKKKVKKIVVSPIGRIRIE